MDYLTVRRVIVGLILIEVAAIIIMFPDFYRHQTLSGIKKYNQRKDYEKALSYVQRWKSALGKSPREASEGLMGRFLDFYMRRTTGSRYLYYIYSANYLTRLKRYEEAQKSLDDLKKEFAGSADHPVSTTSLRNIQAVIFMETGKNAEALALFNETLRTEPTDAVANYHVGRHLYQRGEYLEASLYLRQALTFPEFQDSTRQMLADIDRRLSE